MGIAGLVLCVVVRECGTTDCRVIGEASAPNYALDIPSGQRRAFREYLSLSNMPTLRPGWAWSYSVETIEAKY